MTYNEEFKVKIYAVKILDIQKEKLDELCLQITPEKKCKIQRFVNKEDKIRTLIGEILIRTIIAKELNFIDRNVIFDKNEHGKPYLKDYLDFNFNISHSGELVVCAIDDKTIGIDIEQVKYIEYKEIAECFFSTSEFNYIMQNYAYIQLSKFYEIWTLKESYIKCCGQGLSIPLKSFSIYINRHDNIKIITNDKCNTHMLKILDIEPGYKMAVCSIGKEIPNDVIVIDQNTLINRYLKLK